MEPEVTVVIPCRNGAATIGKQLDALVHQVDAPPFEVVIADNGSSDNLEEVCVPYTKVLELRIVRADEVAGVAYARNVGVREARGKYILICDADDLVSTRWVSSLFAPLRAEDCVVSGLLVGWNGEIDSALDSPPDWAGGPFPKGSHHPVASGGNCSFRRSSYIEVGGFDTGFHGGAEDIDMSWRLQEVGKGYFFAREAVINYRDRPTLKRSFVQHYRYTREDVRAWKLAKLRGYETHLVSFRGSLLRLRAVPQLVLHLKSDRTNAATLGCIFGSIAGNFRYRLLRRSSQPCFPGADWFRVGEKRA